MLMLNACTDADSPENSVSWPVSITVNDSGFGGSSRAAEEGYRTGFSAGDACGLYVVRKGRIISDNIRVDASVGEDDQISWTPAEPIFGGFGGESYFLYYPYQEDMTGKVDASAGDANSFFAPLAASWEVKADQSDYADYTSSDLMTADGIITDISAGNLSLSFSMAHRMALAVIELPKTVYKFTNTDVTIPDYIQYPSIDFAESEVKPYAHTPGTYRYIVNPAQSVSLSGTYDNGKKEFAFALNRIPGSYRTYKMDGLTPIEKPAKLQPGDYFCKDSDNKWYIIPGETTPDGNVIGIVFYAGQDPSDKSDYTSTGIGRVQCHGYVVALTDVHNDDNDCLRWEWGPNQEFDREVGASNGQLDWQGYSNSLKFQEYVSSNEDWEMKHFPAALACETYGKRTLDRDGNDAKGKYDWQQGLAAPTNSSGWFLPSYGQLTYLYQNRSDLSDRMDVVKNSVPDDCNYKDKIEGFNTSMTYWSSAETSTTYMVRVLNFSVGGKSASKKDNYNAVRAILAF